jgi:hypothetical protein
MALESEMPIFCDNCSTLAVAAFGDELLCTDCLLEAVRRAADPEAAAASIRPICVHLPAAPRAADSRRDRELLARNDCPQAS